MRREEVVLKENQCREKQQRLADYGSAGRHTSQLTKLLRLEESANNCDVIPLDVLVEGAGA